MGQAFKLVFQFPPRQKAKTKSAFYPLVGEELIGESSIYGKVQLSIANDRTMYLGGEADEEFAREFADWVVCKVRETKFE